MVELMRINPLPGNFAICCTVHLQYLIDLPEQTWPLNINLIVSHDDRNFLLTAFNVGSPIGIASGWRRAFQTTSGNRAMSARRA